MKIACLGWGSLIWDHGRLPIQGEWFHDGPMIPVEFARQSSRGRITLVLTPGATAINSLWTILIPQELAIAKEALRAREGVSYTRYPDGIGVWKAGEPSPQLIPDLAEWSDTKGIEGVVWTALPPEFNGVREVPTEDQIIAYLGSRDGTEQITAKEYVERAPKQIDTAYRRKVESTLGWVPKD